MKRVLVTIIFALSLVACGGGDPGPLKGTWRMGGVLPIMIQFRNGETEAMGMIEKVSYERGGQDVIMKYESGLMKGTAMRFTITGPDSARSELGALQRVR